MFKRTKIFNQLIALISMGAIFSCSKEPAIIQVSDVPIAFQTVDDWSVMPTKDGTTTAFDGDSFAVISLYHPAGGGTAQQYMWNQKIVKNGSAWTYSPMKYWPATDGDKLSFYAYAPHIAAATASVATDGSIHMSIPLDGNKDLVCASTANNQSYIPGSQLTFPEGQNGISFHFQHLLKKLQFQFIIKEGGGFGDGHYVSRMEVSGQPVSLDLNLNNGQISEQSFSGSDGVYVMGNGENLYPITYYTAAMTVQDALYISPYISSITISLLVSGVNYGVTVGGFGADGKATSYLITLTFDNKTVQPTVSLTDWNTVVDNNTGVRIEK